jgi:ankyrin repeat protein
MTAEPLPFLAPLSGYEAQARELLAGHRAADAIALGVIHRHHPRFLDDEVKWLPRRLSPADIAAAPFDLDDARLALARIYSFADWAALAEHVQAVADPRSPTRAFESAVQAVIGGDLAALGAALERAPGLVSARSTRRTCHDPPEHRSTLLHYVAANGVEGYNQRSPPNAVAVATLLLESGAEPDALARMYGGECTTLSLLVSSSPPAEAGVQLGLVHTLLDHGAAIDGRGSGEWRSPLWTALVFGCVSVAEVLVARGARVDGIALAAGLGRVADVRDRLGSADARSRHAALALAAQLGHAPVVRVLIDAGVDPDRYNPQGLHSHATPLHQAALAGHAEVVRLLVERGARLDLRDELWDSTPLGWAVHGQQTAVAEYLREHRNASGTERGA